MGGHPEGGKVTLLRTTPQKQSQTAWVSEGGSGQDQKPPLCSALDAMHSLALRWEPRAAVVSEAPGQGHAGVRVGSSPGPALPRPSAHS